MVQVLPISVVTIQAHLLVFLVPLSSAEYGHSQFEMHTEYLKTMRDKPDTFTNKYVDTQLFAYSQKEIQGLFKKCIFRVITSNKVIIAKKILGSIQVFKTYLVNDIKDTCTNKANDKSCHVIYTYNK